MPKPRNKEIAVAADMIREIALSFDGASEVDRWGRPAFRTTKRMFAVIRPDGLWLHLPEERKEFLFEADPQSFVKFMWGRHPEIIVQPDRVSKTELSALLREAYESALPQKKEGGRSRPRSKGNNTRLERQGRHDGEALMFLLEM